MTASEARKITESFDFEGEYQRELQQILTEIESQAKRGSFSLYMSIFSSERLIDDLEKLGYTLKLNHGYITNISWK